jgi:MFS family permease
MASSSAFTARERTTLIGITVMIMMVDFQDVAVDAILPSAAKDLNDIGAFGWVVTGYVLAKIVGLVLGGQYSDSHGPRVVLIVGLALFAAGQFTCGLAPTMPVLIAGRAVQGVSGGLLVTAMYVVVGQVFPGELVPRVLAALGFALGVPVLVGPLLAGAVAQYAGWRWAFLGFAPCSFVGLALLVPALRGVQSAGAIPARRNGVRFAIAVALAVAVLEHLGQHPPRWPLLLAVAVPAFGLLGSGLRALMPAGTFRLRPGVAASVGLRGIFGGAFLGADALIPLTLTLQHHYAATAAALPLAASGAGWALGSWIQGRPPKREDGAHRIRLVRVGITLAAVGTLVAAAVASPSVPGWWIYAGWCIAGLGAGMTYSTFNLLVLRHTTDADRGFDSAAMQLSSTTAAAITTGLGGVLVAQAAAGAVGYDTALSTASLIMAALLVLVLSLSFRLRSAGSVAGSTRSARASTTRRSRDVPAGS